MKSIPLQIMLYAIEKKAAYQGSKWVFAKNQEKCVALWRPLPAQIVLWGPGRWEELGNPKKLGKF